jgi:hypothetical protein
MGVKISQTTFNKISSVVAIDDIYLSLLIAQQHISFGDLVAASFHRSA